jgi:Metallo-peptidase family M12
MRASTCIICGLLAVMDIALDEVAAGEPVVVKHKLNREQGSLMDRSGGDKTALRAVTSRMMAEVSHAHTGREDSALLSPTGVALPGGGSQDLLHREQMNIVIDVLVAYTRRAASRYVDIKGELIDLAVERANQSFRYSNIGHISLRVVHVYQTDYVEEGTHFEHVWRFADNGDGYMDEVHQLRDMHRADVAVLIVDDPRGCGLATRVQADADDAFAVVHHECAAANYTLAHEIGHLIGARHELAFVSKAKWRDIMGYKDSCGGCPRLPLWSNPGVFVDGEPAGTAELDNARVIAEQAARVAAFR